MNAGVGRGLGGEKEEGGAVELLLASFVVIEAIQKRKNYALGLLWCVWRPICPL